MINVRTMTGRLLAGAGVALRDPSVVRPRPPYPVGQSRLSAVKGPEVAMIGTVHMACRLARPLQALAEVLVAVGQAALLRQRIATELRVHSRYNSCPVCRCQL